MGKSSKEIIDSLSEEEAETLLAIFKNSGV